MPCFQFAARPFLPAPRISVRARKDSAMVSTGSTAPSFSRKIVLVAKQMVMAVGACSAGLSLG